MSPAHRHTSKMDGKLGQTLMPGYIMFLLIAPFAVALLFAIKGYLKVSALLILGNGIPAYFMLQTMFPKTGKTRMTRKTR